MSVYISYFIYKYIFKIHTGDKYKILLEIYFYTCICIYIFFQKLILSIYSDIYNTRNKTLDSSYSHSLLLNFH